MSRESEFVADVLESTASALAGYAVLRLFELEPGSRSSFSEDAAARWKAHLRSRILELSVAVRMEEPQIFVSRVLWARKAFRAREVPEHHLEQSLAALAHVLSEEMPESAREIVHRALDPGRAALARRDEEVGETIDPATREGGLALRYLAAVLEGDARGAIDLLLAAVDSGMDPIAVMTDVLFPAQREVGQLWHWGESDVAEEHLVTATTLRALSVLARCSDVAPSNGRTVIVAAVEGNDHDLAVHALGFIFERHGWKSVVLGANVPVFDLVRATQHFAADLLVLSVTLSTQLRSAAQTIDAVRAIPDFPVRIVVGGPAFDDSDVLWARIGADGHAPTMKAAVSEGARLLGLDS